MKDRVKTEKLDKDRVRKRGQKKGKRKRKS
jgi:hypothetical protein